MSLSISQQGAPVVSIMVLACFRFVGFVALFFIASCGGSPSTPTSPSPSVPTNTAPPVPTNTPPVLPARPPVPVASLIIELASVIVHPTYTPPNGRPFFGYEPRFRLRETAGISGATIENIFVGFADGGGDNTGPLCWRDPLRVPPGGTLDIFHTDEGSNWLGYCAASTGGHSDTPEVHLVVSFTDDEGRMGHVRTILPIAKKEGAGL
jgi:hypothetical protein